MPKDTRTFLQRVDDLKRADALASPTAPTPIFTAPSARSATAETTNAYADAAAKSELEQLSRCPNGGRNDALNISALKLARLPLDRDALRNDLVGACEANGLVHDDGLKSVEDTIKSAFAKADADGPRTIPERPDPNRVDPHRNATVVITNDDADPDDNEPVPVTTSAAIAHVLDAEQGFWEARPSLTTIRDAALNRMCAPWAVLGHVAARALAGVRPCITLPALIGGPGSLNWYAAIVAPSGGGKGSASSIARQLTPNPVRERNIGSGEGIIGAFHRPGTKTEPPETHESVMFTADEVDTLTAMGSRTGSTTMSILRSGFAGETLGFSYVTRGRDVHIDAHGYRMTLVISVQPARAGALMGDHGGGTPQRFMWFPGVDPRIHEAPDDAPIPSLTLPRPGEWRYPRTIAIPDEARTVILTERAKAARGEAHALDGHAVFCREKFAFALAVLDGRIAMSSEDWALSGIAAEVSTRTRSWAAAGLDAATHQDAMDRGRLLGVTYAASDDEKLIQNTKRTQRIARWVLRRLEDGPMTQRELNHAVNSRDRPWLANALESLSTASLVSLTEGRWSVS